MTTASVRRATRVGIVGGLGELAGADLLNAFVRAAVAADHPVAVLFEQHPFSGAAAGGASAAAVSARKFYVFDQVRALERRQAELVLVPCFISRTFLDELQPELGIPILDLMAAVTAHLARRHPRARRIGVLASDYVRAAGLFDRELASAGAQAVHPGPRHQAAVMAAVYGPGGIRAGGAPASAALHAACLDLQEQGAEVIVPGITELPLALRDASWSGLPLVDVNQVYARHALDHVAGVRIRPFKIGIVGGVGPAATVDFMDKIVRHTGAGRDQDHVKMVVEHNPQIPDRTAHLLDGGADPTIALYAACKRLEADDADLVAIPCNTAHAFVGRVQPHLSIPIVNMLDETARHLAAAHPERRRIGLLATSGTVASRVYHDALAAAGCSVLVPDAEHQALVMAGIYGPDGIKAGCADGASAARIRQALRALAAAGAEAVILGCSELPLLFAAGAEPEFAVDGVPVLDPTAILARACVRHATAWRHAPAAMGTAS